MGAIILLALLGWVIDAMYLVLLSLGDLQHHVAGTIALLTATSVFYLISAWLVLNKPQSRASMGWIVAGALVFRLTAWLPFPAFSQDVFRYRWEGKLQAAGGTARWCCRSLKPSMGR